MSTWFYVAAGVIVALVLYFIGLAGCHARWADSGMRVRYSFMAGCRVQQADGRWIPEDRVRELREWRGEDKPQLLPPTGK